MENTPLWKSYGEAYSKPLEPWLYHSLTVYHKQGTNVPCTLLILSILKRKTKNYCFRHWIRQSSRRFEPLLGDLPRILKGHTSGKKTASESRGAFARISPPKKAPDVYKLFLSDLPSIPIDPFIEPPTPRSSRSHPSVMPAPLFFYQSRFGDSF